MFYTKEDFLVAIHEAGVNKGDLVMVHTGMSSLRAMPKGVRSQQELSAFCAECLMESVGKEGTLVVPSFTYSLGGGNVYDSATTPTRDIGEFPAYFWQLPEIKRNNDPFLAVAVKGPLADDLLKERNQTSYGHGSFFDIFCEAGGKLLTIGVGMRWATIRYYFTEYASAPFRYLKVFSGKRKVNGRLEPVNWEYSVAPWAEKADKISRQLGFYVEDDMVERGLVNRAPLGRGFVSCIDAQTYRSYMLELLTKEPWIVGGDIRSEEDIISAEIRRTGKKEYIVSLDNKTIEELGTKIANLPRYPFSDAYDAAVDAMTEVFPLEVEKIVTGTKLGQWVVPERWVNRNATLATVDGDVLITMDASPLLIATQSRSFSGEISREELLKHIYMPSKTAREKYPDATPYIYRDIERTWGLCISGSELGKLTDDKYRVEIDTDFSYGQAQIAQWYLPGESESTILLATYMDTPCQINTGLSGVLAGLKVMESLSAQANRHYSYRLLILPKQLGISGWQYLHPDLAAKVVCGFALDNLAVTDSKTSLHIPYGIEVTDLAKKAEREEICVCYGESFPESWKDFLGINTDMPIYLMQGEVDTGTLERPCSVWYTSEDTWENADEEILLKNIDMITTILEKMETTHA